MFNPVILLHIRAACVTLGPRSRNVSLDQKFPWPQALCWAEAPKEGPAGYGGGQSGEL